MMLLLYFAVIFLSLFILYVVSRHDFVLLRQSVSLRQVFDNVFLSLIVFFLLARVAYIFYVQSLSMFNPLKFFYLTKYWGLLPYAGLMGMIVSIWFLFRKKKNKLRILDVYFISFSPIILLDVLLKSNHGILLIIKIISALILVLFYGWFLKIHNKFTTKDGFITFITIITYSLTSLAFSLASYGIFTQKYLWFNVLLVVATIVSLIFLLLIQRETLNKG